SILSRNSVFYLMHALPTDIYTLSLHDALPILFYVRTERPQVALTFDISWGRETAIPVLDVLQDKNVKATFFLTGFWAKRHADIEDRKSTRLNSSHVKISYAVFCLKKKTKKITS